MLLYRVLLFALGNGRIMLNSLYNDEYTSAPYEGHFDRHFLCYYQVGVLSV
jgi:hypothetical protein